MPENDHNVDVSKICCNTMRLKHHDNTTKPSNVGIPNTKACARYFAA